MKYVLNEYPAYVPVEKNPKNLKVKADYECVEYSKKRGKSGGGKSIICIKGR